VLSTWWFRYWSALSLSVQRWCFGWTRSPSFPRGSMHRLTRPDGTRWQVLKVPAANVIYLRRMPQLATIRRRDAIAAEFTNNVIPFAESYARRAGNG